MKKIEGGVTAAQGFEAASAAARIKYEGRTDMALIFSKAPCECAGTFTTNVVKAAPVIWDREMVYSGAAAHAVIVNSGIANACTGMKAVIGGIAKGSGMIHPNMCTMLGYVTTDAAIEKKLLQKALSEIVQETFNMISVDGDTSTNDTLLVLANGLAGNAPVCDEKSEDYAVFYEALKTVCRELAMKMAGDGKGCTRLIETRVIHADTLENARILAKSVITSSLTKAAVFGKDANWGRILCALGYSGAQFDPENCDLYFGEGEDRILIFTDGSAADYSEEKATELLSGEKVVITADMHMGEAEATAWGCDLTYDYVKINADYRS